MKKIAKIMGVFIGDNGEREEIDLKKMRKRHVYKGRQEEIREARGHRKELREAFEAGDGRKARLLQNKVKVIVKK